MELRRKLDPHNIYNFIKNTVKIILRDINYLLNSSYDI